MKTILTTNKSIKAVLLIVAVSFSGMGFQAASTWEAPSEADKLVNPLEGNVESIKAGKNQYKVYCNVCHGDFGKGDGVAGMSLEPRPANFTSEKIQLQSDGAIFWKLTNGNAPMAAYKDILSEEERWQLVNYIRTFVKKKKK